MDFNDRPASGHPVDLDIARGNRLLALLALSELEALPGLETLALGSRDIVYDLHKPIEFAYFPATSVISLVAVMANGKTVESATVGREGVVGIPLFLGADRASHQAFCQVPGDVARMPRRAFRNLLESSGDFHAMVALYAQAMFTQVTQTSACNRLHSLRERMARWLLQTHDRVGGDVLRITHAFLAQMLGVRRATVSDIAGELQYEGLISYSYRDITIQNRAGLEAASCECYAVIDDEFDRLLAGRNGARGLVNSE